MGEAARLQALHDYGVLDAPADDELSAVVRAAAVVAGVPTATLNLIDENRQCQLTTIGFDGGDSAREESMCALVFASGRSTHVSDARLDARFAANPWVTGRLASVRFYASVPLVTPDGYPLGSLCVFDTEPKTLSGTQMAALEDLAAVVLALFERRRQARRNAELADDARRAHELAASYARDLEARQELMDAVHQSVDVAIVACDPDGHLTLFNQAARQWHGLAADAGPDAALEADQHAKQYDLYAGDGLTLLEPEEIPLHRALREGAVRDAEIVIAPAGQSARTVVCTGKALHRADGTLLGAVVAMTDVTADRVQRAQLAEREALLRAVVDTAPDGFVTVDSTGTVTAWNPAASALFGYTAEQATGRPLTELIVPEHLRAVHSQALARRAATGHARLTGQVQVPGVRRDGSELLLELSLGAFTWKSEPHFHAFLRDVTDREAAREQLTRTNAELAAANAELDRFTAIVAHDLKTPLTAITGYTEILHDTDQHAAGADGAARARALTAISRATARMTLMIDDLLVYARASQEPLCRQPVELAALVDDVAAEAEIAAPRDIQVTRTHLPAVSAHPTLLRQVLANLIGNAIKYVAPDASPHVHISAIRHDNEVTINVTDNGIGIPEHARENVFALFHREPTRERYQGTGVGLTTCRRIIERHGGRIWVEPREQPGTTICFTVPATEDP